jgi:hypothetical protein
MNKIGAFVWPRSFVWLLVGAIFLYLGLMPFFNLFPYNFEIGEELLRLIIVIVGILILIESFRRERGFRNFMWIIIGIIIAAFGIYIFLMGININLPFQFNISDLVLQIILILFALYIVWGSFGQVKIVE